MAEGASDPLPVEFRLSGDLGDLRRSVRPVYRIAQQSIANARRHAPHVTGIVVSIAGTDGRVYVTVSDDGEAAQVGPGRRRDTVLSG